MTINEEHRAGLIILANEYKYSMQSYPADENGEPKEAYLEYLSLMYDPELVKIALELPIMPKLLSLRKLAKKIDIEKKGIFALAPMMHSFMWKILKKHENGVWSSKWCHRHMCFAAGLGSFGVSDGFMNEKGVAMRCGSLIVALDLPSNAHKRPIDPYAFCIKCGTCIKRYPVGAITFENGHDKQKCSEMVMSTIPYIKEHYNIPIYSCGLCQVVVPCQDEYPIK